MRSLAVHDSLRSSAGAERRRRRKLLPLLRGGALFALLLVVFGLLAPGAFAAGPEGMFDTILDAYRAQGDAWHGRLIGPATNLYLMLAVLQAVFYLASMMIYHRNGNGLGVAAVFERLLVFLIFTSIGGVLLATSRDWVPWVYYGLLDAALTATGIDDPVSPSSISTMGVTMSGQMFDAANMGGLMGFYQFFNSFTPHIILVSALVANICFVGIAIQYAITEIAFYIALGISPFFIAFMAIPKLSGLSEGYLKFLLYVSVKIFVLYLLLGIALEIPEAAMALFPDQPETWGQYFGLVDSSGSWVWDSDESLMEPQGITRAALTVLFACLSVFIAITTIPITLAKMISSSVNLNLASWWG